MKVFKFTIDSNNEIRDCKTAKK